MGGGVCGGGGWGGRGIAQDHPHYNNFWVGPQSHSEMPGEAIAQSSQAVVQCVGCCKVNEQEPDNGPSQVLSTHAITNVIPTKTGISYLNGFPSCFTIFDVKFLPHFIERSGPSWWRFIVGTQQGAGAGKSLFLHLGILVLTSAEIDMGKWRLKQFICEIPVRPRAEIFNIELQYITTNWHCWCN